MWSRTVVIAPKRWVLLWILLGVTACTGPPATLAPTATSVPTERLSSTAALTVVPTPTATIEPTPSPTLQPTRTSEPTPEPIPERVEGYWIQNTTRHGLCSDSPRFIGFDTMYNRFYVGGDGASTCYLDYFGLEWWTRDLPSPLFGFPSWITVNVPGVERVTGGTAFEPYAPAHPYLPPAYGVYGRPSFAGRGGRCVLDEEGQWLCFTAADGLPFDDIRGYAIALDSNVEWFMSPDSVASYGLQPQDRVYSIPELVGAAEARPTWLDVAREEEGGVWVGTDGYGVIHIQPSDQRVTRYTMADGLPDDAVRDVQSCGVQCTWVATAGGVGRWDGTAWRVYTTRDGLPSDDVHGISVARPYGSGDVWAATAEGPVFFLENSDRWQSFPDFPAGVEVNGVMQRVFSTRGQGLVQFVEARVFAGRTTLFAVDDGLPANRVTALAETARGVLVGTPQGAAEWDGRAWTRVTGASVKDVASTSIATEEGLWAWSGDTWQQVNNEHVTLVAEDGWYATPGQICRWADDASDCFLTFDGQAMAGAQVLYVSPVEKRVTVVDGQGRHWACEAQDCGSEGFAALDELAFLPQRVSDIVIVEGYRGFYATPWGVCDTDGLADYGLANSWPVPVHQMSLDRVTNTLWIATEQGAFYVQAAEAHIWSFRWTYVSGLPSRDVTAVLALPGKGVWFGTADAGVVFVSTE